MWPFSKKKEEPKSKFDFPEVSGTGLDVPPKAPDAEQEFPLEEPPMPGSEAILPTPDEISKMNAPIADDLGPAPVLSEGLPPPAVQGEDMPIFPEVPPASPVEENPIDSLLPSFGNDDSGAGPLEGEAHGESIHLVVKHKMPGSPIFVEIDVFSDAVREVAKSRAELRKSLDIVSRVQDINRAQDVECKKWHSSMNDLHKKLLLVDRALFE